MARKVLLSSHVSALMKDFYESEAEFIYGLVLGHFDSKDVMVVHLARTPIEGSEDEESVGSRDLYDVYVCALKQTMLDGFARNLSFVTNY